MMQPLQSVNNSIAELALLVISLREAMHTFNIQVQIFKKLFS